MTKDATPTPTPIKANKTKTNAPKKGAKTNPKTPDAVRIVPSNSRTPLDIRFISPAAAASSAHSTPKKSGAGGGVDPSDFFGRILQGTNQSSNSTPEKRNCGPDDGFGNCEYINGKRCSKCNFMFIGIFGNDSDTSSSFSSVTSSPERPSLNLLNRTDTDVSTDTVDSVETVESTGSGCILGTLLSRTNSNWSNWSESSTRLDSHGVRCPKSDFDSDE